MDSCSEKDIADEAISLLSAFLQEVGAADISYGSAVGLLSAEAARTLANRLVSLPSIADDGTGLSFQFQSTAKNKWHLFLNRSYSPLELRASVGDAAKISSSSMRRLIKADAAHLYRRSGVYGRPVDIYLSFKLTELHRRSIHIHSPNEGAIAAIQFRRLCADYGVSRIWEISLPAGLLVGTGD